MNFYLFFVIKQPVKKSLQKCGHSIGLSNLKHDGDHFYLAVVLDLFNREVVGWSMSDSLETGIVLKALDSAMRKIGPDAKVIFH